MKKISHILSILIFIVLIGCCVIIFFTDMPYKGSGSEDMIPFSEGWKYADGTDADPSELREGRILSLYHELTKDDCDNNLCLQSKNINFSVYEDDKCIYDFHPDITTVLGYSYGKFIHNVHISEASVIRIDAEPAYGDGTEYFKDIYLDSSDNYNKWVVTKYLASFVICAIIISFGTLLFAAGLVYSIKFGERIQTMSLGLIAVLSGVWETTEMPLLQMVTGNAVAVHFTDYLCLMLLPVPAIHLIANMAGFPKSRAIILVDLLVIANILFQVICTVAGVGDYHVLLTGTHIVIGIAVLGTVILIIRSIVKHTVSGKKYMSIAIAFTILSATGLIDILMYYRSNTYGSTFMLGILAFVLYLGFYEMGELLEISEENIHASEMHRLAHTDGLTGLENRLSFGEYEQELSQKENGKYLIVQFDINNLKTVNDKYGHSEGDTHIRAAAKMISDSFGSFGRIFRTGGDEFIAILSGSDIEKKYRNVIQTFREDIDKYNETMHPPVKMSVACGMAEYWCGDELSKSEILADSRMYENKKVLKSS